MKKIKIDRAIQERPATRKQTRNEKIRQSLTEHVDVQVIPAITDREGYEKPKLRVCAYCRVSTDMDTQALSYELQVQNYTDYIRGNDEWQFAGVFYGIEKDIAKLADILGHSSINTTRIYIISTGTEHRRRMENMRLIL